MLEQQIKDTQQRLADTTQQIDSEQPAWEAKLLEQLAAAERNDIVWIDDQQVPEGAQQSGDWSYVTKDQGPVHSGEQSRKQTAGELVQHFFLNAKATITLQAGDRFFVRVWLGPRQAPPQIILQAPAGSPEPRATSGEDTPPLGRAPPDGPNHKKHGDLPKAGEWVRLEVSPEAVGLKPGSKINGLAFTQWGGLAD